MMTFCLKVHGESGASSSFSSLCGARVNCFHHHRGRRRRRLFRNRAWLWLLLLLFRPHAASRRRFRLFTALSLRGLLSIFFLLHSVCTRPFYYSDARRARGSGLERPSQPLWGPWPQSHAEAEREGCLLLASTDRAEFCSTGFAIPRSFPCYCCSADSARAPNTIDTQQQLGSFLRTSRRPSHYCGCCSRFSSFFCLVHISRHLLATLGFIPRSSSSLFCLMAKVVSGLCLLLPEV